MDGENTLDNFFGQSSPPIDIVIILEGALQHITKLADYGQGSNLLFYRPKTSHRTQIERAYLLGEAHPSRTVLFFDDDMLQGNAVREAAKYFEGLGYSRDKMFVYLVGGFKESSDGPQLMHIDRILEECQKVHAIAQEIGHL